MTPPADTHDDAADITPPQDDVADIISPRFLRPSQISRPTPYFQGIGNGMPLGDVVTTPEIANVLTQSTYFNTFGGNPVCTVAGLAVLNVIEKESLQMNALTIGSHLKQRLSSLKEKYQNVRGRGLMIGVELVKDRQTNDPAKAETLHIMEEMREMGVLVGK